ncbi:flagellar protein FlaG [Bacillus infantis]|uniref:flagellar protein FlaG n=1 Tax=Bacillus infantis TaxID=324767 RepID=UPI0020063678|nr:flagellar protein FlaG [Bacillus infantis]MCK6206013.1 flagellar protein FlaG [Bacillus infantis]
MLEQISNLYSPLTNQAGKLEVRAARNDTQQSVQQVVQPLKQSKDSIEKVVKSINNFLEPSNSHLKFEFHEDLKEYYVTIVDDTTKEVIKEIPSKKLLDMYSAMKEYLGLLVDKKI